MRNLGCNCGRNSRLGQTDQYGNVLNYDTYYNTASATAENLWNDVEGAAVWAGNQLSILGQDFLHPGDIPGNPMQQGYQAGQATRNAVTGEISSIGSSIGSGISNVFSGGLNSFLVIGAGAIILLALAKDK